MTHATLTRYAMYEALRNDLGGPIGGRVLGVSGLEKMRSAGLIDADAKVIDATYPDVDMQALPHGDEEFDVVVSDQVIEHLADPRLAVSESMRVLRRGGIAIHTTCFLNPLHPSPQDYFRFTRDGLLALMPPNAEVVSVGTWGNRVALGLLIGWDASRRISIPPRPSLRRWLARWNEEKYGIMSWVVARKAPR